MVTAGSPAELVDLAGSLECLHLIILNIGDAHVRNSEVLGKVTCLRRHVPQVPLVLLIDGDDIKDIFEAMADGVRGFITTSMALSEVGAALQYVAAGGTFVPAGMLLRFAQDRQSPSPSGPSEGGEKLFASLTAREGQVLARLGEGKPNKVIARELGIREGTVKVFVRRILGKLHVSNRTQLALLARTQSGSAASKGSERR